MSLILEALRKSEAQRRLGQAPDLLSPMLDAEPAARRRLRGVAFAAGLVAVAAIAWWLGQHRVPPMPVAATRDAPAADSAAGVDTAAITATLGNTQATPTAMPATSAPHPVTPTPPPRVTTTARAPDAARQPSSATARVTPPRIAVARAAKPDPAPPIDTTPATLPATALPSPPAPAATARLPALANAPTLPSLIALPSSQRQGLPPLRVTMHVYADEAARRFAIIDGHRVGEGALLADGVTVAEIARDGVVLDVRGQRYLLPRP